MVAVRLLTLEGIMWAAARLLTLEGGMRVAARLLPLEVGMWVAARLVPLEEGMCVIQFTSFSRTVSNHNSFQLNQILYLPSVNIYHLNLPGPLTNWLTYFRFWLRFRRVIQIFRGIILRLSQNPRSLILLGVTKDPSHFLKLLHRPLK